MLIHEATDAYLSMVRLDEARVQPPSQETLDKAIKGDKEALADLYTRYEPELRRVARSRARGMDDLAVQDIVQDFFVKKILSGKLLKAFNGQPKDLIKLMVRALINDVRNANQATRRSALKHKAMTGTETASTSSPGSTAQAVRAAFQKILKDYDSTEANFIRALMVSPEGAVGGGKGSIGTLAAKYAPKSVTNKANWGTKAKKRFLKRFCADQGICRLLRSASPAAKAKAKTFCKGVKGACVEMVEVFFVLHPLLEGESEITEDLMEQSVLNWIRNHSTES